MYSALNNKKKKNAIKYNNYMENKGTHIECPNRQIDSIVRKPYYVMIIMKIRIAWE